MDPIISPIVDGIGAQGVLEDALAVDTFDPGSCSHILPALLAHRHLPPVGYRHLLINKRMFHYVLYLT